MRRQGPSKSPRLGRILGALSATWRPFRRENASLAQNLIVDRQTVSHVTNRIVRETSAALREIDVMILTIDHLLCNTVDLLLQACQGLRTAQTGEAADEEWIVA